MGYPRNSDSDFWKYVVKTDDCWNWTGHHLANGYGQFAMNMAKILAHRYSYQTLVGAIPTKLALDHLCRNRSCVNPKHLEPVTIGENVLRGVGPTAKNAKKITCKHGHPLDGIRAKGGRTCKTCARLAYHRKRGA